jgi:hypothetical protein
MRLLRENNLEILSECNNLFSPPNTCVFAQLVKLRRSLRSDIARVSSENRLKQLAGQL